MKTLLSFILASILSITSTNVLASETRWEAPDGYKNFSVFNKKTNNVEQTRSDHELVLTNIQIRNDVSADINVHVSVNNNKWCNMQDNYQSRTIVTIHGITHTAATWGPLTKQLFIDNPTGDPICNILSIDLPGHGKSSLPNNILFGDLSFDDYANSVKSVLARLNTLGYTTPTVIGFSHGGYILQLVQQSLIRDNSNLHHAYGVKKAVFLGSSLPTPLAWEFADSGIGSAFITSLFMYDPKLGTYVSAQDELWPTYWFVNKAGILADNAPTPEQVKLFGYNTIESSVIASQLLAVPPYERPSVIADIYSRYNQTKLFVVAYNNDIFMTEQESESLYQYLTGDLSNSRFILIEDEQAIHDYHMSEPYKLLLSLKGKIKL